MARTRADVREAELLEDLADRALVVSDAEALGLREASARLTPSSTAASDSRRRLWLACLEAAARRRSSSAEKSALTVTAVAMARILPRHGISSTSRGESPTSQNGRPLVSVPSAAGARGLMDRPCPCG